MTLEAWVNPSVAGRLAHRADEGAAGRPRLRHVREHRHQPPERARLHHAASSTRAAPPALAAEHVDAPGRDLRRHDAAALRQRHPGRRPRRCPGNVITSTGALRIGGNAIWGEYFQGSIDEVRVYRRVLSAAEIQTDMTASVVPPDTQPPTAPTDLTATGSIGQVALSWTAATDNVGVARYNVHRSAHAGFTPTTGEPRRAADRHELHRHRSGRRHVLLPRDRRGRRRQPVGPSSNEATAHRRPADTTRADRLDDRARPPARPWSATST